MQQHDGAQTPGKATTELLARAIARHVHSAGDHQTALPALSLHRRDAPTDPVPCIYPLSLALTSQGDKQVLAGDRVLDYFPGHSLLTTIDLRCPAASSRVRSWGRGPSRRRDQPVANSVPDTQANDDTYRVTP